MFLSREVGHGFGYSAHGELVSLTPPGSQQVTSSYDSAGRLSGVTHSFGRIGYGYNAGTGMLQTVTTPASSLAYSYDGALPVGVAWSGEWSGTVGYAFDTSFRVASVSVNAANPQAYSYDRDGLLTRAGALVLSRQATTGFLTGTSVGVVNDTLSYSAFGELATYRAQAGASGTPALLEYQLTRDVLGRITQKVETLGGVASTYTYSYDLAGRLAEVQLNGALVARYNYDANGNRLARTTALGSTSGSYDAQDRLLAYGSLAYTYTPNGELASKTDTATGATTSYVYDSFSGLRAAVLPDGTTLEYVIDGQGRRVGKKRNGNREQGFLYDGQLRVVAELDAGSGVVSRFVYGTLGHSPDLLIKGGVTYRVVHDHLGSVRLVVNSSTGAVAQRMDYDEWGNVVLDTNPGFQPFGFAGGIYDRDTGLVRFGARDYDPVPGRWTSKDPISFGGGDANQYRYVASNPLNSVDPAGLELDTTCWARCIEEVNPLENNPLSRPETPSCSRDDRFPWGTAITVATGPLPKLFGKQPGASSFTSVWRYMNIAARRLVGAPVLPGPTTKLLGRAGALWTLGAGATSWGVIAACAAECSGR